MEIESGKVPEKKPDTDAMSLNEAAGSNHDAGAEAEAVAARVAGGNGNGNNARVVQVVPWFLAA